MLTPSEKGPLSSLTINAAAAAVITSGAGAVGLTVGNGEANFIASALFAAVAIYGRWRATKLIK